MTIKEFNNYKFSSKTEVLYKDIWRKVMQVDFIYKEVLVEFKTPKTTIWSWIEAKQIKDIRN